MDTTICIVYERGSICGHTHFYIYVVVECTLVVTRGESKKGFTIQSFRKFLHTQLVPWPCLSEDDLQQLVLYRNRIEIIYYIASTSFIKDHKLMVRE